MIKIKYFVSYENPFKKDMRKNIIILEMLFKDNTSIFEIKEKLYDSITSNFYHGHLLKWEKIE